MGQDSTEDQQNHNTLIIVLDGGPLDGLRYKVPRSEGMPRAMVLATGADSGRRARYVHTKGVRFRFDGCVEGFQRMQ